jgi:hypothetical protein
MKELKDYSYEELTKLCIERVVEGMLQDGLKGIRSSVEQVVEISLRWKRDTEEYKC